MGITPRATMAEGWAELQFEIGYSAMNWASASEGPAIADLRGRAISAYRLALEVFTRAVLPQQWAMTQNNLGIALRDQASASEGAERARLLGAAAGRGGGGVPAGAGGLHPCRASAAMGDDAE